MKISDLPPQEQPHASHINNSLGDLESFVEQFTATLSLYNFCRHFDPELTDGWQFVAARDGAMSLFHFAKVMEGIREGFKDCPTFRGMVDHTKLREAGKTFNAAFPQYEKVRHSVAHAGELSRNIEARKQNSVTELRGFGVHVENTQLRMSNVLYHDEFAQTIDGMVVSYKITKESLVALSHVKDLFLSGFAAAPKW